MHLASLWQLAFVAGLGASPDVRPAAPVAEGSFLLRRDDGWFRVEADGPEQQVLTLSEGKVQPVCPPGFVPRVGKRGVSGQPGLSTQDQELQGLCQHWTVLVAGCVDRTGRLQGPVWGARLCGNGTWQDSAGPDHLQVFTQGNETGDYQEFCRVGERERGSGESERLRFCMAGTKVKGRPVGRWQEWRAEGRLSRERDYSVTGERLSERRYSETGLLESEFVASPGSADGHERLFGPDGKLVRVLRYERGRCIIEQPALLLLSEPPTLGGCRLQAACPAGLDEVVHDGALHRGRLWVGEGQHCETAAGRLQGPVAVLYAEVPGKMAGGAFAGGVPVGTFYAHALEYEKDGAARFGASQVTLPAKPGFGSCPAGSTLTTEVETAEGVEDARMADPFSGVAYCLDAKHRLAGSFARWEHLGFAGGSVILGSFVDGAPAGEWLRYTTDAEVPTVVWSSASVPADYARCPAGAHSEFRAADDRKPWLGGVRTCQKGGKAHGTEVSWSWARDWPVLDVDYQPYASGHELPGHLSFEPQGDRYWPLVLPVESGEATP